jgi:tetrapyrrole methylase family protein/MazG family protein
MTITILGLGPGRVDYLTQEDWRVLSEGHEVYVRTRRHPTVADLPTHLVVHDFDGLYEREEDFAAVYEAIAQQVISLSRRPEGVLYAVPGHPLVGETTVQRVLSLARAEGLPVRIVEGLSFIEPTLTLLGLDALAGVQIADATELASQHHPPLNPDRPALVSQLYGRGVASGVKLTLMSAYPDEHSVTVISGAGTADARQKVIPLYELDVQKDIDHLTTLYVPPLAQAGAVETFQDTVARLRAPDGCPWDREQTHLTLRSCLLEETHEVLHALDSEDMGELREELGDLLMQIVIHAQIATEEGDFKFADIVAHIDSKIKRRHPHVFGTATVNGSEEVLQNWEEIKRSERGQEDHHDILSGVPTALPALALADSYQRRVVRVGFDWPNIEGVLDKVAEELAEVRNASDKESQAREIGDLLFALVNYARWLEIDAESALRGANARFARRFSAMERLAHQRGARLEALSLDEQEALWQEIKKSDG